MKLHPRKLGEKGQSAIEFIVTFTFTFGLLFLFIRLALNFTTGYLAHYATFMASRVFLTKDNGFSNVSTVLRDAEADARSVFKRYKLPLVGVGESALTFNRPTSSSLYEYVGAHFKYQKPFSFIKAIGGDTQVEYLTESFLGKEPPRSECYRRVCWAMTESGGGNCQNDSLHATLFDNGC